MTDKNLDRPTLVIGGTGKTGRRVANRLRDQGLPVRIGSRRATIPFDWQQPDTWAPALEGVRAAYISYHPDLALPGAVEAVGSLARTAVGNDVRRLVLLAGRGEPEAEQAERAVIDSGADVTVIRATWFAQNFSEDYMLDHVLSGVVALPAGDVPEPFVDAEDIADVAVAALTESGHEGETYELTGPRLLTFADAVAEIAVASGRPLEFVTVSIEDHERAAIEHGVPKEIVALVTYLFGEVLDGRNAIVTDGVRRALGREPRDFSEYASRTAKTGVWTSDLAPI